MLEEAAENLGSNQRTYGLANRCATDVWLVLAGFVTSFATASIELSATIMLVAKIPMPHSHLVSMNLCSPHLDEDQEQCQELSQCYSLGLVLIIERSKKLRESNSIVAEGGTT